MSETNNDYGPPLDVTPRSLETLSFGELNRQLERRCSTEIGRQRARTPRFFTVAKVISDELDLVSEARALRDRDRPLPLGGIHDLRPVLKRLQKAGILEGLTLVEVAETLRSCARLSRFIVERSEQVPKLAEIAVEIIALKTVYRPIETSFDEKGFLLDNASEELSRLRRRKIEIFDRLSRQMRALMERSSISKYLQDRFYTQREERFVLPVRTDAGPAVEGIVHGSSASGATLFVEPKEVVELNNQLKVIEIDILREETRILAELSMLVGDHWEIIDANLEKVRDIDYVDARAKLALSLDASPAKISNNRLELLQMRHPLIALANKEIVANDLLLDKMQGLIISGPNAGGKTVALKTVGLCVLMHHAGMHIPAAPDSQIPVFRALMTEMGDDQSIEHNLSTFTAHLTHLMRFIDRANHDSLVLIDEIAVGTDPAEGAALAQAVLERLIENQVRLIVTTHYQRLKALPVVDRRFVNLSVGFDLTSMSPTFQLHAGIPGSSGALAVARRCGLREVVATRAEALMQGGNEDLSRLLEALSEKRNELAGQGQKLRQKEREVETLLEKQRDELTRLKKMQRADLQSEFKNALEELKRARDEIGRIRALLKKSASGERLEQANRRLESAAKTIRQHEPTRKLSGRQAKAEELLPGTPVNVARLGGAGTILASPQRGRVSVRVGRIRTTVPVDEILIVTPGTNSSKTARKAASQSSGINPNLPRSDAPPDQVTHAISVAANPSEAQKMTQTVIRTSANTLDLRGQRVEEALEHLDKALDDALRACEQNLFVIHGHGTGALKSATREFLQQHRLVSHHTAAKREDGGDGVTIIRLK